MRRPGALLIGSVLYLAAIFGVMLWRGISIEPEWVLLALLVIAIAVGRGVAFLTDWGPFLLLFLAYEAMRGFASKTGFAPHDLSGIERALFGGTLPTLNLQHAFYQPDVVSPQDVIAMFFYFMHFPLPILVGFIFWLNSREHYRRFIAALLLMCFVAFVTYLFWPSAPPWWQEPKSVVKIINRTVDVLWGTQYYVSAIYHSFNPNQFAAFPSLHAAFPALAAVYAWHRYRVLSIALIAWTAAVLLSIVYLGEHYAVDALAGYVYVAAATLAVEGFVRWRRNRSATPARPSA
ncbi:MAG TPA: phosphatase PAP2 family protein [Candidatus Dormibacteraeota bacterium]|nr:phosphatase PAP2 family protein [Candidatus Dormibacteraeota bacterium]